MHKPTIREQTARVMAFAREKAPKGVKYQHVMYKFTIGRNKAIDLCQMAATISECYTYKKGTLKYICTSETDNSGFDTLEEAFKDDEAPEGSDHIGESEAEEIRDILDAKLTTPEDKGHLEMPRKPKEDWNPNDFPG